MPDADPARTEPDGNSARTDRRRLGYLDGIRGLAATYVVVSHAWDTVYASSRPMTGLQLATTWMAAGRYAVTVFIVVSGFSLGLTFWRANGSWPGGPRDFLWRRGRRILPPYWIAVALCSLVGATVLRTPAGTLWDGAIPIRWSGVLSHLVGFQDIYWAGPAGSTAFWSLAVEIHIYLAFAVALVVLRRWTPPWLLVFTVLAVASATAQIAPRWWMVTKLQALYPSLYAMFLLGLVAAKFAVLEGDAARAAMRRWRGEIVAAGLIGMVVVAVCLPAFSFSAPTNDFLIGPVATVVVVLLARGGLPRLAAVLRARPTAWLGHSSYSLYLIHPVVLEITWRWLVRPLDANEPVRLALTMIAGTVLSIAVSRVFYRAVERPFMSRRSRPPTVGPTTNPAPTRVGTAPRNAAQDDSPRGGERDGDNSAVDPLG